MRVKPASDAPTVSTLLVSLKTRACPDKCAAQPLSVKCPTSKHPGFPPPILRKSQRRSSPRPMKSCGLRCPVRRLPPRPGPMIGKANRHLRHIKTIIIKRDAVLRQQAQRSLQTNGQSPSPIANIRSAICSEGRPPLVVLRFHSPLFQRLKNLH